jgi:hypothetical protein
LLDQNLGLEATAKIEHIDKVLLGTIFSRQTLQHLVAVGFVLFHSQKGISGLKEVPDAPRRIRPQCDIGFDLAAFSFGGLDNLGIGGWNHGDENPIEGQAEEQSQKTEPTP